MGNEYHIPVLLSECMEGLRIKPDEIYVDATCGGGGHAREILKKLTGGKLYAFDRDEEAVKENIINKNLVLINDNFKNMKANLEMHGVSEVNGILADLGVSSHQLDSESRGFSFRFDSALDMRMDLRQKMTAAEIVNSYSREELKKMFSIYGELKNSGAISSAIIKAHEKKPIEKTTDLVSALSNLAERGSENKFYAKVFQALRIEVNAELDALKSLLQQSVLMLRKGGRLVIISYHSLEDRLVKNYIRSGKFSGEAERDLYGNVSTPFIAINKKPVTPSEYEIKNNPRARSAKLRIAEKR